MSRFYFLLLIAVLAFAAGYLSHREPEAWPWPVGGYGEPGIIERSVP